MDQRGSVMVMVALWLPLLALFASFAIDASHWWDYSRNLQNRADAAALAAGDRLGVCLGSPSATVERGIGEVAQQYAGVPTNTPDLSANIPYTSAQMTADGFPSPWFNAPNLTSGGGPEGPNYHLLLNSSDFWPTVAQNGANGYGTLGSYCSATDPADPSVCPAAKNPNGCPLVDVRLTQGSVPMFIDLLGLRPNITAHARAQLTLVGGSSVSSPIAVGDAGDSGCVVARLVDETNQNAGPNSDGVLKQWSLASTGTAGMWSASMPGTLNIPTSSGQPDQLAVQAVIPSDCTNPFNGGDVYDAPTSGNNAGDGIVFVNTYAPLSPPVSNASRGSVWLEALGCTDGSTNDPYFYYFTSGTCTVRLHAQVDFPSGSFTATAQEDGNGAFAAMTSDGTDAAGNQLWHKDFTIPAESGRHTFALGFSGSRRGTFDGGNPVQATFAAFSDGTGTDDSGPVVGADVGCDATSTCPTINGVSTSGATGGVDSIPGSGTGSTPKLSVTFQLLGLEQSGAADPPVILRSSVQSGGRTGELDCGQGGGASAFAWVMQNGGCGTATTSKTSSTLTSGLTLYSGSLTAWTSGQWPFCTVLPANPISCGEPLTGNTTAQAINNGIAAVVGSGCDKWQAYKNGTGPLPNSDNDPGDPRAIELAITTPQDLALPPNDPRWIRIVGFATFYVTGWAGDPYLPGGSTIPGCTSPNNQDEAYPLGGSPKFQVWGHFIQNVVNGAPSSGNPCTKDTIGDCTPSLTR